MKTVLAVAFFLTPLAPVPCAAQTTHDQGHHMMQESDARPELPGDDTFGAIAEIVEILRDDPSTDWSEVSIIALREHLLDMDAVVKGSRPETAEIEGGIEITIAAGGAAGAAARRMLPAHAPVLADETGWRSRVVQAGDRLAWRVTGDTPGEATQIRALGFFGLLATGAHHQAHHLAIARGGGAH